MAIAAKAMGKPFYGELTVTARTALGEGDQFLTPFSSWQLSRSRSSSRGYSLVL